MTTWQRFDFLFSHHLNRALLRRNMLASNWWHSEPTGNYFPFNMKYKCGNYTTLCGERLIWCVSLVFLSLAISVCVEHWLRPILNLASPCEWAFVCVCLDVRENIWQRRCLRVLMYLFCVLPAPTPRKKERKFKQWHTIHFVRMQQTTDKRRRHQ